MKKFILMAAVCLFTVSSCSPLRIIMNRTNKGERTILTSNLRLFSYNGGTISAALGTRIRQPKDTLLAVLITCDADSDHGIFDKDDRLLMRLTDGSQISLTNLYDKEFETETTTNTTQDRVTSYGYDYTYSPWTGGVYVYPYEVSTFIPRTYTTKTSYSYALYLIPKQDLKDIIDKGVTKLRVEIENKELDMPNPNAAKQVFANLKACLYNGIHNRDRSTNDF